MTRRAGNIDRTAENQIALGGYLDEAAVTARRAGVDRALEVGRIVGPHHHGAAAAARGRSRLDGGATRDIGRSGVTLRPASLDVAADHHHAARHGARGLQARVLGQSDLVGEHRDMPAAFPRCQACRVQQAGDTDRACVAAVQDDRPVRGSDSAGLDDAVHVDDVIDYRVGEPGGQPYRAAIGLNGAGIHHPARGVGGKRTSDIEGDQPVAVKIKRETRRRPEHDIAHPGVDQPRVLHSGRDQDRQAPVADGDRAQIDDPGVGDRRGEAEIIPSGEEVAVCDIGGRGHQPAHVDLRGAPEDDAVGVDQENPAVGGQVSENAGWIAAAHPVEHDRRRRGLDEVGPLMLPDIEPLPVDGRLVGMLMDIEPARRGLDDLRTAANQRRAARIGNRLVWDERKHAHRTHREDIHKIHNTRPGTTLSLVVLIAPGMSLSMLK